MVNSNTSPKRRRTDGGPVTAEGIAQSNATLHVFTGNKQNSWMTPMWMFQPSKDGSGAHDTTNATAAASHSIASGSATSGGAAHGMSAQGLSADQGNQEAASLRSTLTAAIAGEGSAGLVDYQSPYAERSRAASATAQTGRKSLDVQAGTATTRQGLPSPASSEGDFIQSPILNDGSMAAPAAAPQRRPGRPRKGLTTGQPGGISPTMRQTLQMDLARTSQPYNNARLQPRRVSSSSSPAVRGSARLQTQANAPSPLQRAQSHYFSPGMPSPVPGGRPASFQPAFNANAQCAMGGQAHAFVPPTTQPPGASHQHFAQLFNMPALLEQIEARLHQLALADSDGTKYRGDQGRLNLLKEAVRLQDSFYMVLSQLFCLRTTSPSSLPQAVSHVVISEVSWRQLEALLCSNESLLAPNVAWFAEFPSPIMNIYSSEHPGFKAAYEAQVRAVADYLIKLPQQWHAMTEASIIRQAPPLTEDMVEQLSLHSPILQNTAFRAIARMYFAAVHLSNMEDGIQALVQLHRADQTQYAQGMRRSVAQKNNAYLAYRLLFNRWKQHDEWAKRHAERQHDPTYEFRGQPLIPFQIPLESLAAFGLQVLSSRNTPISQAQPQEQQQHQQPHAHAHPVRQRQGSISEQPPNPLPPQQLSMAQQSAHALASGQAWFRNAAHGSPLQVPHTTATTPQGGTARTPQPRPSLNPPIPQTTRLLPGANDGARPQPTHPDSTRSALHQAHLRDPTLVAAKVGAEIPKLYRQVETVCLSPTRIHEKRPTQLLTFELGDDCVATLPKQAVDDSGAPPRETLTEASRQYRLRCCKIDLKMSFPNLSSWVEADNIWPDTVYFDFNGQPLDPRRKLQHGRYLPVDLTHLVQPGSNELKVTVNRTTTDMTPFDYAVAVEMVGAISHETLVSTLRTIPAKESLASMQQSLNGPSASDSNDEDDDDVKMISNSLTIKLFDPFSGNKIFDTPVRGELCLHRDPFDLDVFLSTREPRGHGAETPSAVDTWRCPICRKDVRPNILVQDGFLMEVRRELEAKGLLGTSRAIVVSADGTWRVKEEERKGVRSASLEREERARVVKVAKPPPVVIELD